MATTFTALDRIDQELARAAAPRPTGRRPLFLFLKEGHKATIRPLYNLSEVLVLSKHNKYHEDPSYRVNNICATEEQRACALCAKVANDKKLTATLAFYLPVYVYNVVDTTTGQKVTYVERDEDGAETEKPVSGVRLLELTSFGTISAVLKFFREYMRDEGAITDNDFSISQIGSGQKKTFVCMPRTPRPMSADLKKLIPDPVRVRERILEALPPVLANDGGDTPISPEAEDDDVPVF